MTKTGTYEVGAVAYRKTYKELHPEYDANYRAVPANRIRILAKDAICRAKKVGREFDETLPDVLTPVTHCPCCGFEIDYRSGNRKRSPSLDRRDNSKGYTLDNVFVICSRCNSLKKDSTAEELRAIIRYMETP